MNDVGVGQSNVVLLVMSSNFLSSLSARNLDFLIASLISYELSIRKNL